MEKLMQRLESCQRALVTLDEILTMSFTNIVRDASIKRFDNSFESLWKLLKIYLEQQEGLMCNSPKSCFREAVQVGLLSIKEGELCLTMTDDRNLTTHTYIEAVAETIYSRLPSYSTVMRRLLGNIQSRMGY